MKRPTTQIPVDPGIGRMQPYVHHRDKFHAVITAPVHTSLRLLAFVREESIGGASYRMVRRAFGETVAAAQAEGFPVPLDAAGTPVPLPLWPLDVLVALLVPENLRRHVQPSGRVPPVPSQAYNSGRTAKVCVPLNPSERIAAKIAAFGQLLSFSQWGSDVIEDELKRLRPDAQPLWELPLQEQIETLLHDEPSTWPIALAIVSQPDRHATRTLYNHRRLPDPGADFLLSSEEKKA